MVLNRIANAVERFSMDAPTVLAMLDAENIPSADDYEYSIAQRVKIVIDQKHALSDIRKMTIADIKLEIRRYENEIKNRTEKSKPKKEEAVK